MMYQYTIKKHVLDFIKPAKTSRNVFNHRALYIIELIDTQGRKGLGEASPLSLLSIDDVDDYEVILNEKLSEFCESGNVLEVDLINFPSIRFGIETALLNLNSSQGKMFDTSFTRGECSIPVNGLVWMNDTDSMYQEALQKIHDGYTVIKFKVGAQDFDDECRMLEKIRKDYSAFKVTLRVDANGAFQTNEALEQLKDLSRFEIHSIEQPIAVNQWDQMEKLCFESPIGIALDEELIGVNVYTDGSKMLKHVSPHYIILKPNLIGGFTIADEWIKLAQSKNIAWWSTSALESNIGLNAISQWVSQYETFLHQGLGTGALYKTNFNCPLELEDGQMFFRNV